MTGPDPLSAAMPIAGKMIESAQQTQREEASALLKAAAQTPEMVKAAALKAQRIAIRQRAMVSLMAPLKWFRLVPEEYFSETFLQDVAAKLEGVPEEQLQTPKASIAGPAMEALAYSLDEPQLKNMYLNLIAGAVNSAKSDSVHPSFVDTIRHLAADEATLLDLVLRTQTWALARLKRVEGGQYNKLYPCLLPLFRPTGEPAAIPQLPGWVNNWERLGLIETTYMEFRVSQSSDPYAWVKDRPEYHEAVQSLANETGTEESSAEIDFDKGLLAATARGLAFYKAVH